MMNDSQTQPNVPVIRTPAEGIPAPIDSPAALEDMCIALAAGTGPLAVDAERASSFRYSAKAYLVQMRREGAGTFLLDPIACPEVPELAEVINGLEWVLHAADQDLPCLSDLGLCPARLFDTEIAARMLGFERFGLAAVLEQTLGCTLAKEHSSSDWSARPISTSMLGYAALDVELLLELREKLREELDAQGKLEWAEAEFEYERTKPPDPPKSDPWRHIPGAGVVRAPRALATLRELWTARDQIAQREDLSPHRVLPNKAMVAISLERPLTRHAFSKIPEMRHFKGTWKHIDTWIHCIRKAAKIPAEELPKRTLQRAADDPPSSRIWHRQYPEASDRLELIREALAEVSQEVEVPPELLLLPKTQRQVAWSCPHGVGRKQLQDVLNSAHTRAWQIELVTEPLYRALNQD